MSTLIKHLAFVNDQVAVQERLADRFKNDDKRSARHAASAARFRALATDVEQADRQLDELLESSDRVRAARPQRQLRLTLTPEDVDGLPQELMDELTYTGVDKTEFAIIECIQSLGGIASLDQILVGIYRKTGEVFKRNTLTSRLYRMAKQGMLFPVPQKKGVYSTAVISEQEVSDLFGKNQLDDPQGDLTGDQE